MKLKKLVLLLITVFFLIPAFQAGAVTIVDTGEPTTTNGYILDDDQWLAVEFSMTESYNLTDIMGFMHVHLAGDLEIAVYGDNGEIPDTTDEFYRDSISLASDGSDFPFANHSWKGLSGLNWNLSPGTYWMTLEVASTSSFRGILNKPSPSPLPNDAYYDVIANAWYGNDNLDIGIRISGDPSTPSIPEPATMLLLGSGLIGLAGVRRKTTK